ncbi:lanthionine synthetase C family protein [Kitasatospora sp. NPDC096077]|uniref:lanthionine synthetase C family protein n=1 Tax=Kitasatospora sp. NPDC096077 TaxID=3155544 RepID=UPI00332B9834
MTTMAAPPLLRDRALALADHLAEQLQDPAQLPHADTGTDTVERWKTTSLASGYAGISVLFSDRSGDHPGDRLTAHRYLELAAMGLKGQPRPHYGLHYEIAGLGFALHLAQQAGGGYDKALDGLDRRVTDGVRGLCHRVASDRLGPMARFDVLDGLTGLGRYLLLRGLGGGTAMELLLTTLAEMTGSADHHGQRVPRYWSTTPPNWCQDADSTLQEYGHLNLGLAHGIAGPLSLLSLAHRQNVAVDGQESAIRRLVALLERFQERDEYGPYWPPTVSLGAFAATEPGRSRGRVSWCYGAPGVSRALQLAGQALGEQGWLDTADTSVATITRLPAEAFGADHWSLCHGWAGIMHLLRYFTEPPTTDPVRELVDTIAGRLLDTFESTGIPPLEIGHDGLRPGHQPAGFLEGAAGLALALRSYAEPERTLPWDIALVVR